VITNNPIPRTGLPRFHEGSRLRAPRDPDMANRQHQQHAATSAQVEALVRNVALLQQQVNRLRRARGGAADTSKAVWLP